MSAESLGRFATVAGGVIGTWRRGVAANLVIRVIWPELARGLDEMARTTPQKAP